MKILKNKMGLSCGLNEDKETLRDLWVSDEKYWQMRKKQSKKPVDP